MYIRLGFAQKKNVEPLIPDHPAHDAIGKAVESKWHPSWIKAAQEEEQQQQSNPAPSLFKDEPKSSKKWGMVTSRLP